jgi:hypothetical protein
MLKPTVGIELEGLSADGLLVVVLECRILDSELSALWN